MKKMTKAMLMTALICGTMYCGAEPVHANELETFTLDEYVVTAARTETKLVDTPANITIVGADEIESRHYTNVAEVLKDVPGANVLDDGEGSYEKVVMLNGDARVAVLVDGRRVNFAMGTAVGRASFDFNFLPDVNLIERVEILKGSGGALYGSDAVGGVVNIITKKADRSYGKIALGFGSNDARDMSAMYSFKEGKTGVTVSASKDKQGYYKYKDAATDRTKRWDGPSDYQNEKVAIKIDQEITEDSNLELGYNYSKFEGHSIGSADGLYSNGISRTDRDTSEFYARYNWAANEKDAGYLQVYHNEYDYYTFNHGYQYYYYDKDSDSYKLAQVGPGVMGDMNEKTWGINAQQTFTLTDSNKIIVGADYRDSEVDNQGRYSEAIDNLALYINDIWEFAPTWTLNAGVRYDDHSKAGNDTTFSAGLNKKFDENSHVYFNWSEVFKAPTTDDMFQPGGDPNLKPETGETWNIGFGTKIGKNTDVGFNYFESKLDDAIAWNTLDTVNWYCANINEQETNGIEINVNHKLNDNVRLNASYTYVKVENNDNTFYGTGWSRDLNVVPNIYRFGINYNDGKWDGNLWLRSGSGASSERYVDSSYLTVDMTVSYKATKDLSFYAKGYNLFNEAYAERGYTDGNGSYRYPAQSRRFLIGAEYSF